MSHSTDDTGDEASRVTDELSIADNGIALTSLTPARICLGRVGVSLPTRHALALRLDHGRARDAVWRPLDVGALRKTLQPVATNIVVVDSQAPTRETFIVNPVTGRGLAVGDGERLARMSEEYDVVFVLGDGLSSIAVERHAPAVLREVLPLLGGLRIAPVVIARQARVALADAVAAAIGARSAVILIGERPGLSAQDSLSAYMIVEPRPDTTDDRRNCISNIHANGLTAAEAAAGIAEVIRTGLAVGCSGIALQRARALHDLIKPRDAGD